MKTKEKPALEHETSSDSLASDSKPKKRTSETKEDTKESKKQRREDLKEINKKKGEAKDVKKKSKEESKENKNVQKEKYSAFQLDEDSSVLDDSFSQAADNESVDLSSDSSEGKQKTSPRTDRLEEERTPRVSVVEKEPESSTSTDDSSEVKVKRKKKKHRKTEEYEESRKGKYVDKRSVPKKSKTPEKAKAIVEVDNKRPTGHAPGQKGLKLSSEERGRKSIDSAGEGSNSMKLKSREAKLGHANVKDMLPKPTVAEGKEKNISRRADEEKTRERHSVGESIFEKFVLDSESNKGGSAVGKKSLSKSDLNAEERSKVSYFISCKMKGLNLTLFPLLNTPSSSYPFCVLFQVS